MKKFRKIQAKGYTLARAPRCSDEKKRMQIERQKLGARNGTHGA